jgi:phosphoribosylanthranilate isomerase
MSTQLKICGIVRAEDLQACIELGVDAVGINLWAGSRRGVELGHAAAMLADLGLDGGARPERSPRIVGVFVDPDPDALVRACETLVLDAVQLHGERSIAAYPRITTPWIRVVRGTPHFEIGEGVAPAWTLLDAAVPGYGGAGVRADWTWATGVVQRLAPHPVWLAGGLAPDNAAQAIARVAPAGIDVASGAELGGSAPVGWKSRERIAALVSICRTSIRGSLGQ